MSKDDKMTEIPKTVKQWTITGTTGFDCMKVSEQPVPALGDKQVLVKRTPTILSISFM